MRRRLFLLVCLALLMLPAMSRGESVAQGIADAVGKLDLGELSRQVEQSGWLQGDAAGLLGSLASGKAVLSPEGVVQWLLSQVAGVFQNSLWRVTRLLAPALLIAVAGQLFSGESGARKAARYAGLIMTMGFLVADLREYTELCRASVAGMAGLMQAIFPLLVTLLAAVGGTTSSVFYQPAVMAAAGSMTTLIQNVTMPFAVSVAALTMVGGLSEDIRVGKLCKLFRQVANWTLGFGFTVFIGVMTVQGLSAAAVDGVSIRTAKYAMDNFIPIVGGMFADTVDTLVGCSLLVQNAVGVLGLLLLLGRLLLPLLRTVAVMLLYRAAAAVLEPMCVSPLTRCIDDYAEVFSLLFIIQLSVGAMFMLLCAQLLTVGNLTVMLR